MPLEIDALEDPLWQPDTAQHVAQTLLERALQLIDPGPLLRHLRLGLRLDVGHSRADRSHLVIDPCIDAGAHLLLRDCDLFAKHGAQSRGDRLIEVRPHGELRVMQLTRDPRLELEIRNARHGAPDELADLAAREP